MVTVNGLSHYRTMRDYTERTSHKIVANDQNAAHRKKGMPQVPSTTSWNPYAAVIQLSRRIGTTYRDASGRVHVYRTHPHDGRVSR